MNRDRTRPSAPVDARHGHERRFAVAGAWRDGWRKRQALRFLVVGGWNTVFGYLCFVVLYALLGRRLHYLVIGVFAHALAVVNAFVAHRLIVFGSRRPWLAEFVRFNLAQLFVLGCSICALGFLVGEIGLHPLAGQAIVTIAMVFVSYLVHRHFSFAAR